MATNGEIKIDKGVPIPKTRGIYPWDKLKVGDSFILPNPTARSGLSSAAKRHGMKISIRTVNGQVRVWRIA